MVPDVRLQFGVLECIMSGSLWLPNRVIKTREHIPDECPRCGAVGCDEMHLFWECPKIDQSIDSVEASQGYLPRVRDGGLSCLWLRGLLPRSCVQVDPQSSVVEFSKWVRCPRFSRRDGSLLMGQVDNTAVTGCCVGVQLVLLA